MPATATISKPPGISSPSLSATVAEKRAVEKVVLPGQTPQGEPILSVLVKRTYDIAPGKRCVRATRDRKLIPGDVPWGNPLNTCVRYESDLNFKIRRLQFYGAQNSLRSKLGACPLKSLAVLLTLKHSDSYIWPSPRSSNGQKI